MDSLSAAAAAVPRHGFRTYPRHSLCIFPVVNPFSFPPKSSSMSAACVSRVKASSTPLTQALKSVAAGTLLSAVVAAALFSVNPARARTEEPLSFASESLHQSDHSALSDFLKSNSDAVDSLRSLLYQKLDDGEDSEALAILNRLISVQPEESEWKFLAARLLNEMGEPQESRRLFEEILAVEPLSFEALFENAVLMDRCGEGEAVIERLERALELAQSEQKEAAARDVRLIMAQIQYLQKNVDEALRSYEELAKEDPKDYRPYFCQGVIYSLLERNKEAREKFAKYHELSPKKFEVDAYLQTPLSRVKVLGTGKSEI